MGAKGGKGDTYNTLNKEDFLKNFRAVKWIAVALIHFSPCPGATVLPCLDVDRFCCGRKEGHSLPLHVGSLHSREAHLPRR